MVVNRDHVRNTDIGFASNPDDYSDYSHVNMYLHHDGYPQWQGVQLANWVLANPSTDTSRLAAKLVHDHYYDSCYLYRDPSHIDHQYTYTIWTGKKDDIWISCYDQYSNECVFVAKPEKIISEYMTDMDYVDFANGETRSNCMFDRTSSKYDKDEIAKYNKVRANAQKIIDLLTN
tara:strand:+ start:49 stop:573 length:525 start_codon:yes stop_codon:yes gene_type:complete